MSRQHSWRRALALAVMLGVAAPLARGPWAAPGVVPQEVAGLERALDEVRQREEELRAVNDAAAFRQAAERYAVAAAEVIDRYRAYLVQVRRLAASCPTDDDGDKAGQCGALAAASQAQAEAYAKELDAALALQEAVEQARASLQREEAARLLVERAQQLLAEMEKCFAASASAKASCHSADAAAP